LQIFSSLAPKSIYWADKNVVCTPKCARFSDKILIADKKRIIKRSNIFTVPFSRAGNAIYLKEKWNVAFSEDDAKGDPLNNLPFMLR
jgi:hypothetical protein